MSIIGYFESCLDIWHSMEKRTSSNIRDMKKIILQFDVALSNGELGSDKKRIEDLINEFGVIRRSL